MKDVMKFCIHIDYSLQRLPLVILLCLFAIFSFHAADDDESAKANWAHWREWSPCTEKCGFGERSRKRICNDPAPSEIHKGDCTGQVEELTSCYTGPCQELPVHALVFTNGSYLMFNPRMQPYRYLMIYVHFKPLIENGVIIHRYNRCIPGERHCGHSLKVKIVKRRMVLDIRDGAGRATVETQNTIQLGKWQTFFVQITRRLIIIRLNDDYRQVTKFPEFLFPRTTVPFHIQVIDFDATMKVGSDRLNRHGFWGSILKIRINFKDISLDHVDAVDQWIGFGAPVSERNIKLEHIGIESVHSRFLNKYYTEAHFKKKKNFKLGMSIYFMNLDGLVLFNHGELQGTFMSLSLHNGVLKFCFNAGRRTACQQAILMQEKRWYHLSITIDKRIAKLRVNKQSAVVLTPRGRKYVARSTVMVGGSNFMEWEQISRVTGVDEGFDGVINEITINGRTIYLKHSVLFDRVGRINADGYSISAHVSEVYESVSSRVTLRCDASLFARQGGVVSVYWLESDQLIEGGHGEQIIDQVPGNPFESALVLKPNHHHEGIYSCIVSHDGFRIMTHAFPVLIHTISLPGDWKTKLYISVVPTIIVVTVIFGCFVYCCCHACPFCPVFKNKKKKKLKELESSDSESDSSSGSESTSKLDKKELNRGEEPEPQPPTYENYENDDYNSY